MPFVGIYVFVRLYFITMDKIYKLLKTAHE